MFVTDAFCCVTTHLTHVSPPASLVVVAVSRGNGPLWYAIPQQQQLPTLMNGVVLLCSSARLPHRTLQNLLKFNRLCDMPTRLHPLC
jgi:hypothetical protein